MGLFNATEFFKGVAKEGLNMFDKAEVISEEGLANLKIARDEVNEEIANIKDNHNKAMQIGDSVGGGAFAQYLVASEGLNNLAAYADLSLSDRTKELALAKSNFEKLDPEQKAIYTDGGFSEDVTSSYDKEVEALKVKKGLVNTNNMGEATANTLTGKVQQMVDRQAQPRREDILNTVGGGQLRKSEPIEGGFESLAAGGEGPIDYLNAGAYGTEVQKIKNTAEQGFESFLTTNRFKQEGTNLFLQKNTLDYVGNIVFPDGVGPGAKSTQDVRDFLDAISNEVNQSPTLVAESILKDYYLEQTYKGYFDYTSFYDIYLLDKAAGDLIEDLPETEVT